MHGRPFAVVPPHQLAAWILFFLLQLGPSVATITSSSSQSCQEQCVDQNIAFPLSGYELKWPNETLTSDCDFTCHVNSCRLGCADLSETSTCDSHCAGAGSLASCRQACRAISDIFLNQIQRVINQVSVDADFDPTQGIHLNWSFDPTHDQTLKEILAANLRWYAQVSSTNIGWRWTSLGPQAFRESKLFAPVYVPVNDLGSDVRFRLAVIWRDTVINSPSFHQTFPSLPAHPTVPTLTASLQVTTNSYAICWNSDRQNAEKPTKYRLVLKSKNDEESLRALETAATCHLFRQLPVKNCCVVMIEDISLEDRPAPTLKVGIEMRATENDEPDRPFLIATNGTDLLRIDDLNDYAMINEPKIVPFLLPPNRTITALTSVSSSEMLIGLSDGSIQHVNLNGENSTTIQRELRSPDETPIVQLVVDYVQQNVYAVRETKGIIRCGLKDCQQPTRLETGSLQFIQTIAIDSWNGHIYYATNNGDTFSTPLFPPNAPEVYALSITRRLAEIPPVSTLEVDSAEQRLILVLRNGSLMSMDLIDRSVRNERADVDLSDSYRQVVRSATLNSRLFWISSDCGEEPSVEHSEVKVESSSTTTLSAESSTPVSTTSSTVGKTGGGSCLKSEEVDPETHTVHLNTYIGGFGIHFRDFAVLRNSPRPSQMQTVDRISLLIGNSKGKISWRPPAPTPFQASSNWRLLHYECRVSVVNSEGSREIALNTDLNSTEFTFAVEAGQSYTSGVRVCGPSGGTCSEWSNVTNSAMIGDEKDELVVYAKTPNSSLQPMSLLGDEIHNPRVPAVSEYLSRYVEEHGLKSLERNVIVDFDSLSRSLYVAVPHNGTILRTSSTGVQTQFLSFLAVNHLAVMPRLAIMFVASSYQIAAYRLTSSFQKTLYNCVEESCPTVIGIAAANDGSDVLYYMLQNTNGTVELHSLKINNEENGAQLLAITDKLSPIRQMAFLNGRLAFVTADGLVGTCDQRLSNWNLNFGIKDVQFILSLAEWSDGTGSSAPDASRFDFDREIQFVQSEKTQLTWSLSPPLVVGDALYKIQLFQEGFGGERTVDLSMTPDYTLSTSILKKWESKQKFDVLIDVITPWLIVSMNKTALVAPTKPPSSPTNLRIYVTQQVRGYFQTKTSGFIAEDGGRYSGYDRPVLGRPEQVVSCNVIDEQEAMKPIVNANLTARHSRAFYFSATSGRVSCAVAARNEQNLVGAFSDPPVTIDSSEFRPLVRLFAIDSVGDLLSVYNWSGVTTSVTASPMELMKIQRRQTGQLQYQSVAFICNELYAIRKEPDSSQPFLVLLDINDVSNVFHKISINGDFPQISAMTSDWVANRLLLVGNQELLQISLENFQTQTAVVPKQLITLSVGAQDAKQLTFDPFTNTAYLLAKNGSVFSLNLNKRKEENLGLHLDCLRSQTVTAIVGEFVWNKPTSPTLYALTWNGMIKIDPITFKCSEVTIDWAQFGDDDSNVQSMKPDSQQGLKAVTSFSVADKFFIFATATRLFVHDKTAGPITQIPIQNPPLKQILAASHSSQPYPDRQCFTLPPPSAINFTISNEDRTGALIEVNDTNIPSSCPNISFPQTQYEIFFKRRDSEKLKRVQSNHPVAHVENGILDKETDYDVYLSWFNRYYVPNGVSEIKRFRTGFGFPTAPQDPQAISLTPDTVLLYWKLPQTLNAPPGEIKYKIKQSNQNTLIAVPIGAKQFINGNFSNDFSDIVSCVQNPCQVKVPNLRPSSDYQFWVVAVHVQRMNPQLPEDSSAVSIEAKVRTKDVPGTLRFENATSDSLVLRFTSLEPESAPREVLVQYRESALNRPSYVDVPWTAVPNSTFDPLANPSVNITIDGIRSATSYDFQFVAHYSGNYEYDHEPKTFGEHFYQQAQQARTKAGAPDPPEDVTLQQDALGWYLKWKKPMDNGGLPLTSYAIDFRKNSTSDWAIAERGLPADQQLRWRIDKNVINDLKHVEFRVRAYNAEGFGAYAYTEQAHDQHEEFMTQGPLFWPLLASTMFFLLIISLCLVMYFVARSKRNKARERKLKIHRPFDVEQFEALQFELDTAKLPPEIRNEIQNLPLIPNQKLKITDELGKGSFGIVSRGLLIDWEPLGTRTIVVAVKQMKSDHKMGSRAHFLKEAILMNNFDHPNIIRLLGVVNEERAEQMLVMEYMEGGDLLEFLRLYRQNQPQPPITMGQLISMMIDVGRGCAYLEMNRHVHRDLAARNCLISSRTDVNRITKISDFGMAREMHSSEYYRLNGEDLLPLRWLAPEAAHDGLFTSKSDVWAFGILIWELLTLGDRPYNSHGNTQVLRQLRELDKPNPGRPSVCPDQIWEIIRRTWIKDPKIRPSFSDLLPDLEKLRGYPELQTVDPIRRTEIFGYGNGAFDNSTESGSGRSDVVHFDKSETRSRGGALSLSMSMKSRRRSHPNDLITNSSSTDWSRNESAASGETFTTSVGESSTNYETPRFTPTTSSRGSDANPLGIYNNDAFVHDSSRVFDPEPNHYEMLTRAPPRHATRPRPAPLPTVTPAPNVQPALGYSVESPTRRTGARVSRV